MKTSISAFCIGVVCGGVLLFSITNKNIPSDHTKIQQEKGSNITVVKTTKKAEKLTTVLYSEPTGKVTLTHSLPKETQLKIRLGIMPNYMAGYSLGMGMLIGFEYSKGKLGYFLDGFYEPVHNQFGVNLGISIRLI